MAAAGSADVRSANDFVNTEWRLLSSRSYQNKILNAARQQNTIVFLPTGSGKTYISLMLMREYAENYCKRGSNDHKVILLFANTLQLLDQHINTMESHTPLKISRIAGDMNVDNWSQSEWSTVMRESDVIALTPEVFKNALYCGYVHMKQTCLIVFDESHHAHKNHPMKKILDEYSKTSSDDRPRLLGLTAVLFTTFKKITEKTDLWPLITDVENTFHGKVVSSNDIMVKRFSTNPKEEVVFYEPCDDASLMNFVRESFSNDNFASIENVEGERWCGNYHLVNHGQTSYRQKFDKMRNGIQHILEQLGRYGVFRGCDYYLIYCSILKFCSYTDTLTSTLDNMTTKFDLVRRALLIKFDQDHVTDEFQMIRDGSSNKLVRLFEILGSTSVNDQIILFVRQRVLAKIICRIIKRLAHDPSEAFRHIKPGYITGVNDRGNYEQNLSEVKRYVKENKVVIKQFNTGVINLIASTQVLEEGTDIRKCNVVVQFDEVANYRSYVQARGRARDANSTYYYFLEGNPKALNPITEWHTMNRLFDKLNKLVQARDEEAVVCDDKAFEDVEYRAAKGKTTLHSAIVLLERYFNSFAREYGQQMSTPRWYERSNENGESQFLLKFPPACKIKDPIVGRLQTRKSDAKRYTALFAIEYLHKHGELDDHLLPINRSEKLISEERDLYPCWDKNDDKASDPIFTSVAGTKKKIRLVSKSYSKDLCNNVPKSGQNAFIYKIHYEPFRLQYGLKPDPDHTVGLITSREINPVGTFPLYNKFSSYNVHIEKIGQILLTETDIEELRSFHKYLFVDVLKLVKKFMIYSEDDENNMALFVAPLKTERENTVIDWNLMKEKFYYTKVEDQSLLKNGDIVCSFYGQMKEIFMVQEPQSRLNAYSRFIDKNYPDYVHYFRQKYNITLKYPERPMVMAKNLRMPVETLLPRCMNRKSEKKKPALQKFSVVYFPSEVLRIYSLSCQMFLKFGLIPAVLHRLNYLHLADQFGEHLRQMLHLNSSKTTVLPYKKLDGDNDDDDDGDESPVAEFDVVDNFAPISMNAVKNDDEVGKMIESPYVPKYVDFGRMDTISRADLIHYSLAISGQLNDLDDIKQPTLSSSLEEPPVLSAIVERSPVDIPAPTAGELLETLTTSSSDDVFDYERLETLGDSFLKFAISLSLLMKRPNYDEGQLSVIKGKLLGNRNLYYVGRWKGLSSYMKVRRFVPRHNFCPPCFLVPSFIKNQIFDNRLSTAVLDQCVISTEEQMSGNVEDRTQMSIREKLMSYTIKYKLKKECNRNEILFLNKDVISDKVVADCVESIIGLYLIKCGLPIAYELLTHLQILIPSEFSYRDVMDAPFNVGVSGIVADIDRSLLNFETLEKSIGYSFKDRRILMQALSHSSAPYCIEKDIKSYEQLEFIGDAILDFLITSYIYEYYNNLSSGKLTDLRSALVNNVTFACLAVRGNFHKYFRHNDEQLFGSVTTFVKFQEENHHNTGHAVSLLSDSKNSIAASYFVPKPLGDIFESVMGAIFIDSGKNLNTVWKICYNMMKTEIDEFSKNIPLNPVRQFFELNLDFEMREVSRSCLTEGNIFVIGVYNKDDGTRDDYYGYGKDKRGAKRAVAFAVLENRPFRTVRYNERNKRDNINGNDGNDFDDIINGLDIDGIERNILKDLKTSLNGLQFPDYQTELVLECIESPKDVDDE